MNKKDYETRTKIIRETFNDTRKIKCVTPESIRKVDENIHPGGDIFTTEEGEFIDLEFQLTDFDENELVKYVEFAEAFHEKTHKRISIYIICSNEIKMRVKECPIMSEADFVIKLACIQEDPCKIVLDAIKRKIRNHERLDDDDIHALSMLPVKCKKEDRNYYRREYFKIINMIP